MFFDVLDEKSAKVLYRTDVVAQVVAEVDSVAWSSSVATGGRPVQPRPR
jgi:hypothetical protein